MLKFAGFSDFGYHEVFSKYVWGTLSVDAIRLRRKYDPLGCADGQCCSYAQGLTSNIRTVAEGYGIVTGWGRLTENGALPHILQMVSLPLIAWSQCHPMYQRLGYAQYLNQCQLCGGVQQGGSDSCQVNVCSCPMKVSAFWHVTPCPSFVFYQRFDRSYCVHVTAGFRRGVNEIFPLRGCYAATCCPETSLPNCQSMRDFRPPGVTCQESCCHL
jgi:hypothetical protein